MIILKGYKKETALMVRLKKLSRVYGFTIESELETVEEVKKEVKLTAVQVAELITKIENLEDLKQYSEDKRQVVELAYKKKLKELE